MKKYIFLLFSLLSLFTSAQNDYCPTRLSEKQLSDLKSFQQQLDRGEVVLNKKSQQYVPLKAHIVGKNSGIGYYSVGMLMQTMCELNERFIPLGFHFYLADTITYINDNDLYQGNSDAIWNKAPMYKLESAVNVFFHGDGVEWCGVYFSGIDLVFIKNYCQMAKATTLTHELGHFFGLPHTFQGWGVGAPPVEMEKIDGSNCRTTGDGFCDTKPDYVAQRWNCPLGWNLTDPNNVVFKPDSSLYMSYANDICHSRFSNEQIATMQNNLINRHIAVSSVDTRNLPAPQKVYPLPGDSNLNATAVHLKWNKVDGAFAYHLQVARFGDWSVLNFDKLLFDTSTIANLFGNWPYAWRVKAITAGYTCSDFGKVDTFTTTELPAGVSELGFDSENNLYPNPVKAGEKLIVKTNSISEITLFNNLGQQISTYENLKGNSIELKISEPGFYFLVLIDDRSTLTKRLIVQ